MQNITLELDDELVNLLRQFDRPLQQSARELIVLELYRRAAISDGKAARLLNMGRTEFSQYTARLGIPHYNFSPEEWQDELSHSRSL